MDANHRDTTYYELDNVSISGGKSTKHTHLNKSTSVIIIHLSKSNQENDSKLNKSSIENVYN